MEFLTIIILSYNYNHKYETVYTHHTDKFKIIFYFDLR